MNLVSLQDYAAIINDAHRSAFKCAQAAIEHARVAGEHLIKAKAALKHGEWLPWLAENCEVGERQARKYMQVAENWQAISAKSALGADLTINGALDALAKVREESKPAPAKSAPTTDLPKSALGADLPNPAPTRDMPAEPDEVAKLREQLADREERLAEMSTQQQEMHEELTFLQKVEDAGDQLATALAEVKRQQAEIRILKERINGLMNEKNEAVRAAKMWKAKYDKVAGK